MFLKHFCIRERERGRKRANIGERKERERGGKEKGGGEQQREGGGERKKCW